MLQMQRVGDMRLHTRRRRRVRLGYERSPGPFHPTRRGAVKTSVCACNTSAAVIIRGNDAAERGFGGEASCSWRKDYLFVSVVLCSLSAIWLHSDDTTMWSFASTSRATDEVSTTELGETSRFMLTQLNN